jgi:hypothetical protein
LESLGDHYYMGNTKIATMFASHGASESADGLRWAIGRAGAMAVMWVKIAKAAGRAVGEPNLMCT